MSSFYSEQELQELGFASVGKHVFLSKKASIYNPEVIHIGSHVRIDDFCILSGGGGYIRMGSYIHISAYVALYAAGGLVIDDFVAVSTRCSIFTITDDFSGKSMVGPMVPDVYKPKLFEGRVHLKKHALIGTNSTILPNVVVETGVAVGAHSLVTKSCQEWGIYVGVPVRRLKNRNRDILQHEVEFKNSLA